MWLEIPKGLRRRGGGMTGGKTPVTDLAGAAAGFQEVLLCAVHHVGITVARGETVVLRSRRGKIQHKSQRRRVMKRTWRLYVEGVLCKY